MLGLALIARYGAVSGLGWVWFSCCVLWVVCGVCFGVLGAGGFAFVGGFVVSYSGFAVCFRFRALIVGGLWWLFGCDCFRLCWLCGVFKFCIVYMGFRASFRFVLYWFAFRV